MYNNYACEEKMATNCPAPVPAEALITVVGETHDIALKLRELSYDVYETLFGCPAVDRPSPYDCCCTHEALIETRAILLNALRVLDDIRGKIKG